MSEIDQFITITATDERTATYFLERSHQILNDALALFFETGADVIPDDYRPDLVPAARAVIEDKPLEVPKIAPQTNITAPVIQKVDPSLLVQIPEMVLPKPQQVQHLPIQGHVITVEKNKAKEQSIESSQVYHQNPQSIIDYQLDTKSTITDDDVTDNYKDQASSGNQLKPRTTKNNVVDFILWKNGFQVGEKFTEVDAKKYETVINDLQKGFVPEAAKSYNNLNLVDKRNHSYKA